MVRLAIGRTARRGDVAMTETCGMATAAVPSLGHGSGELGGRMVEVVLGVEVVVTGGAVVVVVPEGTVEEVVEVSTAPDGATTGPDERATRASVSALAMAPRWTREPLRDTATIAPSLPPSPDLAVRGLRPSPRQ